jgi:isoquinoline 1-oxidoreductase subunit beta
MTTRRRFILGTVAGAGGLAIGWAFLPPRQRLTTSRPLPVGPGEVALNGWVKIGADDSVAIVMPKSEMGQGIHTGLAMLLADELDADWARVQTSAAPIDSIYNNLATVVDGLPFHPDSQGAVKRLAGWLTAKSMREFGVMVTGGSSSVKDLWLPMRHAGASARAMLVAAAALQWGVPAEEITVDAGRVAHASGRSARFGELAAAAATRPVPREVSLKQPHMFRLIGKPLARIDSAAKVNGAARFGIDVAEPGMLYASVRMCPTLGGRVASFDGTAAARLPGVKRVLAVEGYHGGSGGVAVIADSYHRAATALEQVTVQWHGGAAAEVSSALLMDQLAAALDAHSGFTFYRRGDVDAALAAAAKTIGAEYRAPYLAHATLEPANCTVQVRNGRATLWAPTQVPDIARRAVAKATGIPAEAVEVHVQYLGGGFGRRLDVDFVGQAAAIAMAGDGAPVKTIWSREQDMRHDFYRPACVARFKAGLDELGRLTAWHATSAGQAILPAALGRIYGLPGGLPDKTTAEGAFDQPYEYPAARVGHVAVELPVPVGFWRSVGHSHQAFFTESFLDEAAFAAGVDPVAFRAALLAKHPRHLAVLRRAAERAGWSRPLAPGADGVRRGRGVALHEAFGSIVAQVAEVSVGADRRIRVDRVVCAIDCGLAVNPNLIRQQMESGVAFGLSAALYGEIVIEKGQVRQGNFNDYPVLRMEECPLVETEVIASTAHPEGVGEPGLPPLAPALANALFAATGQRLRSLPLRLA